MSAPKLGGGHGLLLAGYGPLIALVAAVALITTMAPTIAPEQTVVTGGQQTAVAAPSVDDQGDGTLVTDGDGTRETLLQGTLARAEGVGPCPDRQMQVPGDPYSPPCVAWSGGDNGGETYQGVTEDSILISYRLTTDASLEDTVASVGGGDAIDSEESIERTAYGLVEYFNSRFQFYGRKIELVPFQGRGALSNELLGAGQREAANDAIKVAEEVAAFGDVSALSQPYADALTRQGMMAFGAPYMSRQWYADRRPFAWSLTPDCNTIIELVVDYGIKRLFGRQARWAGGDLQGQMRRVGLLSPDSAEYQVCSEEGLASVRAAGFEPSHEQYTLDIASMSSQAASLVAKLKSAGVTTAVCFCDPILPIFLTAKAQEQNWHPEWIVTGVALTDVDVVGQLYQQDQWSRAFGISALGDLEPIRGSYGYQAYKQVRDDEPAMITDILYYMLYILAIGIQGAGPNLTPETFEQGMFNYPGGFGIAGRWRFGPNNYTPMEDGREIWWDPDAVSVQNDQRGAFRSNPQRYEPGEWPAGEPGVFK